MLLPRPRGSSGRFKGISLTESDLSRDATQAAATAAPEGADTIPQVPKRAVSQPGYDS